MNNLEINNNTFESIKHVDEKEREFWYARELQKVLNYIEWQKFENDINKAKDACINSKNNVLDYFVDTAKMVEKSVLISKLIFFLY